RLGRRRFAADPAPAPAADPVERPGPVHYEEVAAGHLVARPGGGGHGMSLETGDRDPRLDALYHRGATTIYAARIDPRFSYTLYVPVGFDHLDRSHTTLLVAVHGTGRMQSL